MDKFNIVITQIITFFLVVNSGFSTAVDTVKSKIIPSTEVKCSSGTVKTQFGNNYECLSTQKPKPSQSPTATPTSETPKPKPTTDPDPIVTCLIHKDCGGGSTQLRSSVCSNSTCCQIGDKWIFYQSKSKCTQDQAIGGSRIGKIVKYKEYCRGGVEISVYENEFITKKASDGKTYSMTQKDWGCFENSLKNKPDQAIATTNNKPVGVSTITCVLPYGTYQIPQADCDNIKGILSSTESIKRNFEEENKRILEESSQKLNEIKNRTYQPSYTTPTFPTPEPLKIEVPCTKHYQPYGIPPIVVCP